MKARIISILLFFFSSNLKAQPQCHSAISNNFVISHEKIITDQWGNIYESGSFQNTIVFGGSTYFSAGGNDIFIVKYDLNQNLLWSITAGGIGHDDNRGGAAVDHNGNIYVGGAFQSPAFVIGNDTLHNTDITGLVPNVFLFKMDAMGNIIWSRSTNTFSYINDLTTDNSGNVYITGGFRDSPVTFGNFTLNNAGSTTNNDTYIVKYDSSGNVIWAKSSDCLNNDAGITIDAGTNHVFLCGWGSGCAIGFDGISASNSNGNNTYLAKFDFAGNASWVINTNNASSNASFPEMFVDGEENAYVSGNFNSSSITFGGLVFTNNGPSGNDGFIAKIDSGGNVLWGKVIGGISDDGNMFIAQNFNGAIAGACYFSSPTMIIGTDTLTNLGLADIAFFEYDVNGNFSWSALLGGTGDEFISGITFGSSACYMHGAFNDTLFSLGLCSLSGNGNFLARFEFPFQNITSIFSGNNISIFPNPANEQISIIADDISHIEVIDLSGRVISKTTPAMDTDFYTIEVSYYQPGIYMLRIFSDSDIASVKFVKQ